MTTTYQLTESRDDSQMMIGEAEMTAEDLLDALAAFRIHSPNTPVSITRSDGLVLVDEGTGRAHNEREAVLCVELGTGVRRYVSGIDRDERSDYSVSWTEDIDAAETFRGRAIQSARDRVMRRTAVRPEVKYV